MGEQRIEAILITWDENEIPATRKLLANVNTFEKYIRQETSLPSTFPIYFLRPEKTIWQFGDELTSFWHEGKFIPYPKTKHPNKDLAIVKYCTIGVVDQNEYYHSIFLDARWNIYPTCDFYLDKYVLLVFITSDKGSGMKRALNWYTEYQRKGLPVSSVFTCFTIGHSKSNIKGDARLKDISYGLGKALSKFIRPKNTRND